MQGVGLGLRWDFLEELLAHPAPGLSFVEVSPENYMRRGGYFPARIEQVRERFGILSHGLTLSVGGSDPLDEAYLAELRAFLGRAGASAHSDHLCWSGTAEAMLHELLPLPFTREAVAHAVGRLDRVKRALGRPVGLENITWYAPLGEAEMSEAAFLGEVLEQADAPLLLDVNNAYVNASNHGFDPYEFLAALPLERVTQLHVAGHDRWDVAGEGVLVDTHGAAVPDPVIAMMGWVIERTGPLPVILERDQAMPPLEALLDEVRALGARYDEAVARFHARSLRDHGEPRRAPA